MKCVYTNKLRSDCEFLFFIWLTNCFEFSLAIHLTVNGIIDFQANFCGFDYTSNRPR